MASNGRRKKHRGITEIDDMVVRVAIEKFGGGAHRSYREGLWLAPRLLAGAATG